MDVGVALHGADEGDDVEDDAEEDDDAQTGQEEAGVEFEDLVVGRDIASKLRRVGISWLGGVWCGECHAVRQTVLRNNMTD
jgi:hypothetical protein